MERCRSKNPATNEYYEPKDMQVGACFEFRKHLFILIEADEYTLNFMSNKKFPGSDVSAIVQKLKEKFREQSVLIRDTFRKVDEDHSGSLNMSEFKMALRKFNFDVSDQELISIMRKFDPDGDGSIKYDEFCAAVLDEDFKHGITESHGGQIIQGKSVYKNRNEVEQERENKMKEMEARNDKLEELLESCREALEGRDCSQVFMEADLQGDGHCSYEAFATLLQGLKLRLTEPEMELMMESFYDPDVEDQTRPMSIYVLDEALFR